MNTPTKIDRDAINQAADRYVQTGTPEDRETLAALAFPMARAYAAKFVREHRIPLHEDDVVSAAALGLIDAIKRFASGHGAEFTTYAPRRIIGQVKDDIRASVRRARRTERLLTDRAQKAASVATPRPFDGCTDRDFVDSLVKGEMRRVRMAVKAYYIDGLSMQDIARAIGVSQSGVSVMLKRWRQRAKAALERRGYGGGRKQ